MESKTNKKIIILLVVFIILTLLFGGYIVYDKIVQKSNNNNPNIDQSLTNETNNENTSKKIYIKRDGIVNLENVPNNIIGKYVNKDSKDDYFILNSDGTAIVSFPSGDKGTIITNDKITFQLTYYQGTFNPVILEFYTESGTSPYSPIRIGNKYEENYVFSVTESSPTANIGTFIYEKQDN